MHRDFTDNSLYNIGHRLGSWFARHIVRMETYGLDNIPSEGALLMANHASYLDPVFIGSGCDREICYMARSTLFAPGLPDRILRGVNAFPVQRGRPDRGALKQALKFAADGRLVLIFPEGTRSWDGTLAEAAGGAAFLAYHAKAPVVPVYLHNSWGVLSRGQTMPCRSKVRLYVGPAIELDSLRQQRGREAYEAVGKRVMEGISQLQKHSNRSRYDAPSHLAVSRSRLNCPIGRRSGDPR